MQDFWRDARWRDGRRPLVVARRASGGDGRPSAMPWRALARRRRRVLVGIAVVLGLALLVGSAGGSAGESGRHGSATTAHAAARRRVAPRWAVSLADQPQAVAVTGRVVVALGTSTLYAFDDRGRELWRVAVGAPNRWLTARGHTAVVSTAAGWRGFDLADGHALWTLHTAAPPGPVALGGDPGAPIAVLGTTDGGLAGVDARTGRQRWAIRLDARLRGGIATDDASNSAAVVTAGPAATWLQAVDLQTGAPRWRNEIPGAAGTPAAYGGTVVVGAGDGHFDSRLTAFEAVSGRERWYAQVPASFQSELRPSADAHQVVAVDQLGHVTAVDRASGDLRWSTDLHDTVLIGQPVMVDDMVLVTDSARELVTLEAATGRVRARRQANGVPIALASARTCIVVAQRLVTARHLSCFDPGTLDRPSA
jgi:outer membrane protein assembly factor BamB